MRRTLLNGLAALVVVAGGAVLAKPAQATITNPAESFCCSSGGKLQCCGRTGAACYSGGSWCY